MQNSSTRPVGGTEVLVPSRPGHGTPPLAVLEFEGPSAAIIAAQVPPLSRATNLLVFLLVVSVLTASALIHIDKIVSVRGRLVGDSPNIVMQPFERTLVESIEVKPGNIVRKGQVLARLNPTFTAADQTSTKDQVDLLSAKAARLDGEARGTAYIPETPNSHAALEATILAQRRAQYMASLQAYDQRINQLKSEMSGHTRQAIHLRERLGIAKNIVGMREELLKSEYVTKQSALLATDARLELEASVVGAESGASQAQRKVGVELADRNAFIERWNAQISQDLAETRGKLVDAQQRYAKTNLLNQLVVLTAPSDAIVLSVAKLAAGSVASGTEPLIQLVPLDAKLSVEADIAGTDSGYVKAGDEVTIKFDTLPFLRHGTGSGTVRTISADSFTPETNAREGGSSLPGRPSTLYYRAEIALAQLKLHDLPAGFRPVPGMPVTADVKVGTRSVLGYFVDKVLPIPHEGMREP